MVIQTRIKHRCASLAGYASRGQRFPDIVLCRVKRSESLNPLPEGHWFESSLGSRYFHRIFRAF